MELKMVSILIETYIHRIFDHTHFIDFILEPYTEK